MIIKMFGVISSHLADGNEGINLINNTTTFTLWRRALSSPELKVRNECIKYRGDICFNKIVDFAIPDLSHPINRMYPRDYRSIVVPSDPGNNQNFEDRINFLTAIFRNNLVDRNARDNPNPGNGVKLRTYDETVSIDYMSMTVKLANTFNLNVIRFLVLDHSDDLKINYSYIYDSINNILSTG